jgi:multidrug efflux pump subunit AcrA (membrane-fusion protein)
MVSFPQLAAAIEGGEVGVGRRQPGVGDDHGAATNTMKRIMTGTVVVVAAAVAGVWIAHGQASGSGSAPPKPTGPLIARGYTEAPAGTVTVANNPVGGSLLRSMTIKEGQIVKKGDIIAQMAAYPTIEISIEVAKNNLDRLEQTRTKVLQGTRVAEIALQEDTLKSDIQSIKLKDLQRARSGLPPDQKELDVDLQAKAIALAKDSLALAKARLEADLEQNEIDIVRQKAALEDSQRMLEEAVVRSPIDGVVTQILSREGELANGLGIARIVDMNQLRVFATVDELHLARLKVGSPVDVTFRGNPTVYKGKIAIAPMSVKREKRSDADMGLANVRQIEVEIKADDGTSFPHMLGREARVTFP